MRCDFCNKPMGDDETGIMLMDYRLGGHLICALNFKADEKEMEAEGNES